MVNIRNICEFALWFFAGIQDGILVVDGRPRLPTEGLVHREVHQPREILAVGGRPRLPIEGLMRREAPIPCNIVTTRIMAKTFS